MVMDLLEIVYGVFLVLISRHSLEESCGFDVFGLGFEFVAG